MRRGFLRTLSVIITLFLASVSAYSAEHVLAHNLENVADADEFARKLIEGHRAEAQANPAAAKDPILIMHVGNELPSQLRWIIVHLERAHIPFEVDLVEQHELEASLNEAREKAPGVTSLLNYGEGPTAAKSRKSVDGVWKSSMLMLKRVFGMPNGFTMWFKMKRTKAQRIGEATTSIVQGGIAGLSLGFSLYVAQKTGANVDVLTGAATLMSWVTVNMYWARQLAEWQSQGRSVVEHKQGEFKVRKGQVFFYLTSGIRSLITNVLVVGGAFGIEKLTQAQTWQTNFENTAINLVARSWIDQWINSHQATTLPDGTVVVKEGQWSPRKTIVINTVWNVAYGMLKNLHLLDLGSFTRWTYVVMGVAGAAKMVYDERYWFKRKFENLGALIRGEARQQCVSVLTRKGAITPADAVAPR